ncbi:MAG: PqqD family protein [Betaproteobacteria bacterium]
MTFRINTPAIAHQTIAGETILINLENGTYYSARGSGAAILSLVDRGLDGAAIVSVLRARHPADGARIEDAVTTFLDRLLHEALICERDAAAADGPPIGGDESAGEPFADPELEIYTDLKDLLFLDPIHEVTEAGWRKPER